MRSSTLIRSAGTIALPIVALLCVREAAASLLFSDVTEETGTSVESNSYWGAGIAFFDVDGDGDLDLYVVDGEGDANRFFRNDGNREFTEVAGQIGLAVNPWGKAVVPADIDNDGDADILLTTYSPAETNRLFRNDGGTFVDITAGSGFDFATFSTGAAWADYDGDSLVDCYITTYDGNHRNRLLRNLGGGVFQNVAPALGVEDATGWGYQPGWLDYDFDGDPDLYVANDDFFGGTGNKLFRNNGDGTFTDVSAATGAGISIASMGLAIGDFDNDVDLDIYITNLPAGNVLLRNDEGVFTDVTAANGVAVNYICWGADFFDADNDGWLDLYVVASDENGNPHDRSPGDVGEPGRLGLRGGGGAANWLFRNLAGQGFADVSAPSGADNAGVSYCSAVGDYDGDGDLDLYVTNLWQVVGDASSSLYENRHHERGAPGDDFLRVRLIGTVSNRDAIGAKVWIRTLSGWQLRERQAGTSYLSSSEPTLHFGLAEASVVDRLFVMWPSGLIEEYGSIPAGTSLTLVEGDGVPSSLDPASGSTGGWALTGLTPNPASDRVEIRLRAGTERATLEVRDVQGRLVRVIELPPSREGGLVRSEWDRRDRGGRPVAAGTYFLRLLAGGEATGVRRLVVLE